MRFTCPVCDSEFKIKKPRSGELKECPTCGVELVIFREKSGWVARVNNFSIEPEEIEGVEEEVDYEG